MSIRKVKTEDFVCVKSLDYKTPHYIGHRNRLRKKWTETPEQNFADYEILELLLFYSIPRKDVKPLTKKLLKNFGGLSNLFNANKERLLHDGEVNENTHILFRIVVELINRILKEK